ncbi:MAG TPA: DotU family type IV/VI secretion system protein [Bryobacteraceae bacterium]|nr:DotU family type IV/VI secretion system protein [Bryobacteraceae bacterium]
MPQANAANAPARPENMALIFQELFTAIERLRSNRQAVSDAESFRHHIREAVKTAAQEARNRAGYSTEDIRMGTLAVVGFLDETILNLQDPMFANWPRQPLQEELFGTHMAGEVFFQNLQELLARGDAEDLADVLEVHYLCLLLGYRGRYSLGNRGELQSIMTTTAQKIRQIRGEFAGLAPGWRAPQEHFQAAQDPWTRRLVKAAVACFVLAIVLFLVYRLMLGAGASGISGVVS